MSDSASHSPYAKRLARVLRTAREAAGLNQEQAGAAVGRTRQMINSYERETGGATPSDSVLEGLAAAYRTTSANLRAAADGRISLENVTRHIQGRGPVLSEGIPPIAGESAPSVVSWPQELRVFVQEF